MRAALRVLLSLLLLVTFAAWIIGIWSGDGRWGWTGSVLILFQALWPAAVDPVGRVYVCSCPPLDKITPETHVSPPKPPRQKRIV